MKLPLVYFGHPVLRKKTAKIQEITPDIKQLAQDMIETMHAENGIGLAAPQVNVSLAIFVTNVPHKGEGDQWIDGVDLVYINPEILEVSDELEDSNEGCLSIPKLYATIHRPNWVRIAATDLEGNRFEKQLSGLDAINFFHENDHLNGVLFIDRLSSKEKRTIEPYLRRIKEKYNKS